MVDVGAIIKVAIPLFILGLVTSLAGSLLVSAILKASLYAIVTLIVELVFAAILIFLALWQNDSQLSKNTYWILAVVDIVGGITAPLVPYSFHDDSGYLNRVVVYFLILVGIIGSLAAFWRFLTGLFLSDIFEGAGIDKPQETLLYVFWGVIDSFILVWFIPLTESYQRDVMWKGAVTYTIGFWFVGAVLAAALGVLVVIRGGSAGGGGSTAAAAPKTSEYDNIG
jgi:hypothetical protein